MVVAVALAFLSWWPTAVVPVGRWQKGGQAALGCRDHGIGFVAAVNLKMLATL
jgi:hypothetical protein